MENTGNPWFTVGFHPDKSITTRKILCTDGNLMHLIYQMSAPNLVHLECDRSIDTMLSWAKASHTKPAS